MAPPHLWYFAQQKVTVSDQCLVSANIQGSDIGITAKFENEKWLTLDKFF